MNCLFVLIFIFDGMDHFTLLSGCLKKYSDVDPDLLYPDPDQQNLMNTDPDPVRIQSIKSPN